MRDKFIVCKQHFKYYAYLPTEKLTTETIATYVFEIIVLLIKTNAQFMKFL